MKKWLINKVKYSPIVYNIYYYIGTFLLKILKLFVKADDRLILFSSFGGRKFDDSPRAIYEAMLSDNRFDNVKIIWAFINPSQHNIPRGLKISTDGISYYRKALKSRIWITNSSIERGLSFIGKKTFYFDTWHGTPLKKMGEDISKENKSFRSKGSWPVDVMTAQGEYEADIFSRVFDIPRDRFKIIGLPRNDKYDNYSDNYRQSLREHLGISHNKKVILYAPTFREYDNSSNGVELLLPINFQKWKEILEPLDFQLFFRAHYEVAKSMRIKEDGFIRDMSDYPILEDLMIASDILISDYSSIFFDYSIMDKPMFYFCYDYNLYEKERGLYFDIREWLLGAENEQELLDLLSNIDNEKSIKQTIKFRNNYVTSYGNATKQSLDIIAKELDL